MPNIIGDIAGQYDSLMVLLKKMPDDEPISVGDMIDRGPKSKEVVEWFMNNGQALFGNHEHLMVDEVTRRFFYNPGTWMANGGGKTLDSFGWHIPDEVVEWVCNLPLSMEFKTKDGVIFVAHSFLPADQDEKLSFDIEYDGGNFWAPNNIIWNRGEPKRIDKYIMQIAGHNSQFGLRRFADEKGEFAVCVDSSRDKILTGIHIPSMEIFQQPYI